MFTIAESRAAFSVSSPTSGESEKAAINDSGRTKIAVSKNGERRAGLCFRTCLFILAAPFLDRTVYMHFIQAAAVL